MAESVTLELKVPSNKTDLAHNMATLCKFANKIGLAGDRIVQVNILHHPLTQTTDVTAVVQKAVKEST